MRPSSPDKPQKTDFLVSFLVDARGGSMTGARRSDGLYICIYIRSINLSTLLYDILSIIYIPRSGVRVVIPPQAAEQPVRLTIRQLRPEQVTTSTQRP